MPTHSIDYLNARAANGKHSTAGGTSYAKRDRILDVAALQAARRRDGPDQEHSCTNKCGLVFAEFRAWFAESTNQLRSGDLDMEDGYVPF